MRGTTRITVALALVSLLSAACGTVHRPLPAAEFKRDHPVFSALATFATGVYDHETDGSPLEGDTSAGLLRLQVEGNSAKGFGGGASLELMGSDDDLFEDEGFTPTQAGMLEFAPYFLYRVAAGDRFRMPVRVGPYFHALGIEDQTNDDTIDWYTYGIRGAVEPEVILARRDNFEFSLLTEVSLGFGATDVDVDSTLVNEEYSSEAATFGFEFGPRFRFSAFCFGVSFIHRSINVDDSDRENGIFVRGIESSFTGVAITLGARF